MRIKKENQRAHDEQVLKMVRMRSRGISLAKIAAKVGISSVGVYRATEGVRAEDIEHCAPESPAIVSRAYGWGRQ